MDEFGMDDCMDVSEDYSDCEVDEGSVLDEMLGVSDSVEGFGDEDFDVTSLEELPDVDAWLEEEDEVTAEELEDSYPSVTDLKEFDLQTQADLALEQMLAEWEESQMEDEDPDQKVLKLVKRR